MSLVACEKLDQTPSTPTTVTMPTPPDGWAIHNGTGINLKIKVPDGWDTYNTESGIVLSEHMGTAETGGVLEGLLVYVFVPHSEAFELPHWNGNNLAWAMLKRVVSDRDYVGNALASEPQAFDWDGNEAAYYLLNNRDGTLTMLLAVELSSTHELIVCHMSMPEADGQRIRPLLPDLLGSLTINGGQMRADALQRLPNPLNFPADDTTEF
jgi:hypothetical protein